MAIDAKVSFLNKMEQQLASVVTAAIMVQVLTITNGIMDNYEMQEVLAVSEQNEDLLQCYLDALKVMGRSPKTIARYRYVIGNRRTLKGRLF